MKQRHLKIITLLVLCGVIALSAAAFGGQSATTVRGISAAVTTAPARVESDGAAPLSWLARTLRVQLGLWFGIQLEPPQAKNATPAVSSPKDDGPVKSQTGTLRPNIWEVASDNGGEHVN